MRTRTHTPPVLQAVARGRWHAYARQLVEAEGEPELTRADAMFGPRLSVAQKQVLRRAEPSDWRALKAVTGAQVVRMALAAWRAWSWIKQRDRQVRMHTACGRAPAGDMPDLGGVCNPPPHPP